MSINSYTVVNLGFSFRNQLSRILAKLKQYRVYLDFGNCIGQQVRRVAVPLFVIAQTSSYIFDYSVFKPILSQICQQHVINICCYLRLKSKRISEFSEKQGLNSYIGVIGCADSEYINVNIRDKSLLFYRMCKFLKFQLSEVTFPTY